MKLFLATILVFAFVLPTSCTKTKSIDRCGDGIIDPGEECDKDSVPDTTCNEQGYYEQHGTIKCSSDCSLDLSVCLGRCGDGWIQAIHGEECDGTNLADRTCVSLGLGQGELACNHSCRYDTAGCELHSICGDGVVAFPVEQCEPDDLLGQTCLSLGYYGGTLACAEDCRSLDETDCANYGKCGDGDIQAGYEEECDGENLDDKTCESFGFGGGTLVCDSNCRMDTQACTLDGHSPVLGILKYIPGGTFLRNETPDNLSTVSTFWMSVHEVTRQQYLEVMGTDPSNTSISHGMTDPVQNVNWYAAIAFCNKLSLMEGRQPVYTVAGVDFETLSHSGIPTVDAPLWNATQVDWSANGYRLPTEMEWMWAAMGADVQNPGATNTTGFLKLFAGSNGSNILNDHGWHNGNSDWKSHPVGEKLPNELGLYDVSGNIYEWCWDLRHEDYAYPNGPLFDYRGPDSGLTRINRGGAWSESTARMAIAYRSFNLPHARDSHRGFRVVRY